MIDFSRRSVLKASGALATMAAAKALFPAGAFAQGAGVETTKATLGYIALTDASPLIIAKEKGFFAKYGMPDVEVVKQASWGTTRDNLELGAGGGGIAGAQHLLLAGHHLVDDVEIFIGSGAAGDHEAGGGDIDRRGRQFAEDVADLVGVDIGGLEGGPGVSLP